jgi:hypothetical protein
MMGVEGKAFRESNLLRLAHSEGNPGPINETNEGREHDVTT